MSGPTVQVVGFGRPATAALAEAIEAAKASHPLDPVTVLVASNLAGLSVRRLVGGGTVGGRGFANVSFVTPFRLAELLGAESVAGLPLTNAVLAAAAREVLRDEPGWFRDVAGHHASEAALVALYAELSHLRPATLDKLAARSDRGAEMARLFRAVRQRLGGFHDEDDLARAAAQRIQVDAPAVAAMGTLVWFLPDRLTPVMGDLVAVLLDAAPSKMIVGLTGDSSADAAVFQACKQAGVVLDPTAVGTVAGPPTGTRILSVSDGEEEVRAVCREIAALAEAGVRLDRIGVFHPSPDPYARTLHEHLEGAGIPHNGPSRMRLADRAAGRLLLAVLELPEDGWSRAGVLAALTDAPVQHEAEQAPVGAWENLSREAGIVGGLEDWETKLAALAADRRLAHEESAEDPTAAEWMQARWLAEADFAESLAAFVAGLADGLAVLDVAVGWAAKSEAARGLLERLLGPEGRRTGWPEEERAAGERVESALARLDALDDIEPDPSTTAFVRAVAAELDEPAGRVGRFGEGVLFGPLRMAPGLDLDAVFVVGMAEGACPSPRREDALLPDEDRDAANGELVRREDRLQDQHRMLLAALAAGSQDRVLTFPRGDLRGGRLRLPSRWLLDTATALAGTRIHSSAFALLDGEVVTEVASFSQGLASGPAAASLAERDLMALARFVGQGGDPRAHSLVDPTLSRGFMTTAARRGHEFTAWDGNLAGQPVPSPTGGKALSASALQMWAKCPFSYFLRYVLRLGDRPDPEAVTTIGAADRGSLIHEILEVFIGEVIARPGGPPEPGTSWSTADRVRLAEIAEEIFARYESEGLTGRPLSWRLARQFVLADLEEFLISDDAYRMKVGAVPVKVEMPFGLEGAEPLELDLGEGRQVRFRGKADRVDATAAGGHVVIDYKSGKSGSFNKLGDDPVLAGKALQLGLYAEAARSHLGASDVDSRYWMVSTREGFKQYGYPWTDDRRERFLDVLGAIVDGIDTGTFPALSGAYDSFFGSHENCGYCDFNRLCPRDRDDHERAKADASQLVVLQRLLPPEAEVDE